MKASDYIADFLSKKTQYVFGGQGGSVVHLVNSIDKHKSISFIPGQNEQASSMAADAYYRVSGKLGVAIGTSGPGIINLLQGMACCFFDSIPALFISGAPVIKQIRKNKKIRQIGFQEMEVADLVKPITKYAVLIKDPNKIRYELEKAIEIAYSGRMGPVLIDLPDDLQRMDINPKLQKKYKIKKNKTIKAKVLAREVNKIIKLLNNSKRPLFVIGNGIKLSKSENILKKIINKSNIPFAPTWACVDMFKTENKLNAGTFGVAATRHGNFAIQNSDLLIFLGTRLSPQLLGSNPLTFSPKSKKVLIDIDKFEFKNHRLPKIDVKINCDVKEVLANLAKKKIYKKTNYLQWVNEINFYKKNFPISIKSNFEKSKFVDPYAFFYEMSRASKKNDIIIPDASANLIWSMQALQILKKQKIFTALNHSPMGYSVPASIGAFFADKRKNIIAIIGDGSMSMNIQELETIKHYKVNVKIFIINNDGYGLIKQTQDTWLNSEYSGVDKKSGLSLPNFISVADAYKIKTIKLKGNSNLRNKIYNALKIKGPVVIDVFVNPKTKVKPKIDFGKPLHDMSPALDRKVLNSLVKL